MSLDTLLQRADIWRGGEHSLRHPRDARETGVPTGFSTLNQALPDMGWPCGALTEILFDQAGIGELRLLVPALESLTRQGRWVMLVAPPHLPYAPALTAAGIELARLAVVHPSRHQDSFWAAEQALRSGSCGAVLLWPQRPDMRQLRRLQLAAETGRAMGLLFRPRRDANQPSPAALRLELEPTATGLDLHILKCRGGWHTRPVSLDWPQVVA